MFTAQQKHILGYPFTAQMVGVHAQKPIDNIGRILAAWITETSGARRIR